MSSKYNYLVIDLASMTKQERAAIRLCGNFDVSVEEFAEAMEMCPRKVGRIMRSARRKYRLCSDLLGVG